MNIFCSFRLRTIVLASLAVLLCVDFASAQESKLNTIKNPTLAELRENFKKPHRDYSTGPLWTWNDRLTKQQVRETLRDLAAQNVRQVWVHPRPGLMTPYLSDEWFTMWKTALDEAEKLDMNVWIYDENSYPSGFAGGFVPEALPDSRGMGLKFEEHVFGENLHHVDGPNIWYAWRSEKNENGTETWKHVYTKSEAMPEPQPFTQGKYLIGRVHYTPQGGWFGGKWYVDLLKKGVTEKFIEITFDAYKNVPEIRKEFGNRVPGIFTDEPHPAGSYVGTWVHWNEDIPVLFEKRFGYSLIESLPSLHKPVGDWKKVRHNFHQLILELFAERWGKPCFEWCEANGLEFTGHYWEHGWPNTSHGPDNMAMYIWHQRPAIDLLMNTYNDNSPNAQFGNVRSVKELSSIANQMGRSRTLSENYGAGGWDIRFEDLKRLGDWSYALGVNTNNEHLSYVTIRGARKRDHPQSFSYHVPWFEGYHVLADYFTRLSYVLSQGRQVNRIVVIEPTTTAWMYQGDPKLGEIGKSFTEFVNALERFGVEYDLASEDTIARFGEVDNNYFHIGQAAYLMVVLPPNMENIQSKTLELLSKLDGKNSVVYFDGLPKRVDGKEANGEYFLKLGTLENSPVSKKTEIEKMADLNVLGGFQIVKEESSRKNVFHHRRELDGFDVLFITNTSLTDPANGRFSSLKNKVESWSLATGERCVYPNREKVGNVSYVPFEIPPSGSLLFVLSNSSGASPPGLTSGALLGEPKIIDGTETTAKRLEPNVLTLDFVDVKVGDEERKGIYTYAANRWIFEKHGTGVVSRGGQKFFGNPWDSCVQFKDELITMKFPKNSGFEATYRFTLQENVPNDLAIVIERPDLYKITCNNEPVTASPDKWWLDKAFGVIDLSKIAKPGENEVKITASPMTIYHELEPAYLLGDFSLKSAQKGFVVTPPQPIVLKNDEKIEPQTVHNEEIERVAWLSNGVGFRPNRPEHVDDRAPWLQFDFDKEQEIVALRIWNYNERNLKQRGVATMDVSGVGNVHLPIGNGLPVEIPLEKPLKTNTVKFTILSSHAGAKFPIAEGAAAPGTGFVGLAEVQFLVKDGDKLVPVDGVTVKASSELVIDSHDRKAKFLVDGSGLGAEVPSMNGWNRQGMPFYAGKVEYSRTFKLDKPDPKAEYTVRLPDSPHGWYGATAKVVVNGSEAGFVVCSPWSVDVSKLINDGENRVDVIVYGTPKNLLGPHHAGRLRGSAWPNAFQRGPESTPHGDSYDTIGYGLFEPFELHCTGTPVE